MKDPGLENAHKGPHIPLPVQEPKKRRLSPGIAFSAVLVSAALAFPLYQAGVYFAATLNPPPKESQKTVEAPIKDAEWRNMTASLESASSAYRGHVGIYLKDLHTGKTWQYNPDRLFPSASLIKLPIMAAVFEKIKAGELTLDTQITLSRQNRWGGSGSLKWVRDGTALSVMEILYKMITESDNTATRMFIDHMGLDFLQQEFSRLGLLYTKIYPEGLSLSSGRVRRENYTTAREMAGILERIYDGELISRDSSEQMLEVLKHNKSRNRLRRGLPIGWEIGHKTGLLRRSCHDVGIIFSPRGDYIIAVLTSNVPNYSSAKNFISMVAKLTYKYYRIDADYAQSRANTASTVCEI
ncbi:MAG: hypothetical protein A2X34_02045 [Elusimicrobia bacterium GWC2_51_8]|nr:MAG: hypothetical protein A2X33_01385 [Elusimicrobia bacterium GWA2_51_34]OGR59203.1 MAG: hypothetical protein A2X34_02045 [Elusimicrobia bacterium GWC2_51_8]OGR86399.1 MAG: hypothetical protein A2021_07290 [Elusimicrobia bacterium GWF2_52_66]HAF96180.1 hypothetical protein [Elusimicrobiota bacterium]HCE97791.1 hypothetical protein [Elusimicrobiota bacterium]